MEAWGCYADYKKQEDIKNVYHMMVNHQRVNHMMVNHYGIIVIMSLSFMLF